MPAAGLAAAAVAPADALRDGQHFGGMGHDPGLYGQGLRHVASPVSLSGKRRAPSFTRDLSPWFEPSQSDEALKAASLGMKW
ncbi:hypothetical protein P6U16_20745 [Rhizobium sp. 32-5/1]|uniref:hypothetical protein n=1 Tax=Rhizobium sp. 32-5/1 TaxID=3019602 RepID=UPI00240E999D|nr:hypothetical protein [Rhizobium sp. 32-5/1]WEZ83244.1 hypothetical protein P6U16_20745 [Rhizobium sp. 32-5/1]